MKHILRAGFLALTLLPVPAGAAIVLDDFETGPSPVPGMRIAMAGEGACDHLTGTSRALCGADTRRDAGPDGAFLRYQVDFSAISTILFDAASFADTDPFDLHNGERSEEWGDFFRIFADVAGVRTLLAEFTGLPMAERGPHNRQQHLISTGAGALMGAGRMIGGTFSTFALRGVGPLLDGAGELTFQIRTTGSAEQVGLDNIRIAIAPLPGALAALALALGGLGFARMKQRRV